MFNEGQDAQNCEKDVYVNVDEQDVLKHGVDEQQVGVSVGEHEQEVDELDVDEQEVDEHLDAVLATEGRLHDAAVPVGAGARIGQVCNETEYNTMQ